MIKFISIFVLITNLLMANDNIITIPKGEVKLEDFSLEYYVDQDNNLSIQEIQKIKFSSTKNKISLGYQKDKALWLRLNVENPHDIEKIIYIYNKDGYTFNSVEFYTVKKGLLLNQEDISRSVPVRSRKVEDPSPTYIQKFQANENLTIYIKNTARSAMLLNIQILDAKNHSKTHLEKTFLYAFLFGILLALGVYNAVLFFSIRRIEYLFYVIFIAGSASYQLYLSGIPLEFLSFSVSAFKNLLLGVSILQIALFIFTQKVLETKTLLPKIHKLLNGLIILQTATLSAGILFGVGAIAIVQTSFALVSAVVLLTIGFIALNKAKIATAKYYILSIGLYLIFVLIAIFLYFGVLPYNNFTRNSIYFASLSEVFLLSLLLSFRISILRNRAIESQKNLKNEVQSRNIILKKQVQERTEKLDLLNKQLEEKIQTAVEDVQRKENLLQQQSRLAQMGEMISMIAHQWRQPLGAIASTSIDMKMKLELGVFDLDDKKDRKKFEKYLNKSLGNIEDFVKTLTTTIDDFRDFYKPEKNKEKVKLTLPIQRALQIVETSLESSGIKIIKDIKADIELELYSNEMMQVILNILKNAEDNFLEKKTKNPIIKISTKVNEVQSSILIEDNGGGIPNDIIDKIFDPYFSTKDKKNGTGLGLYMSKIIVQDHNRGKLDVFNSHEGVIFKMTF